MTVFQEMVVESMTTESNQKILVSFFSEDNALYYLIKSKYAIFSNIKVTRIARSAFWDTRILAGTIINRVIYT